MSFFPPAEGGSGTPVDPVDPTKILPEGYEFKLGGNGKLQVWRGDVLLSEQDESGEWIKTSISTGTGSLHLGDLHNNGSGGEQVTWVNTDSNMAYSPPWGAVSTDGATVYENKARTYEALVVAEPNGALNASPTPTPYDLSLTATSNTCFFAIEIVPTESYTGALEWLAIKSTGKTVAEFTQTVTLTAGTPFKLQFKYPLWITTGQTFQVQILKADGNWLECRKGTTNTSDPWRKTWTRKFVDVGLTTNSPDPTGVSITGSRYIEYVTTQPMKVNTATGIVQLKAPILTGLRVDGYDPNTTNATISLGDTASLSLASSFIIPSGVATFSAPELEYAFGELVSGFAAASATELTSFSAPKLKGIIGSGIGIVVGKDGVTWDLPNLEILTKLTISGTTTSYTAPAKLKKVSQLAIFTNSTVTTVTVSGIEEASTALTLPTNYLITLNLPNIKYIGGFSSTGVTIATVSAPNWTECRGAYTISGSTSKLKAIPSSLKRIDGAVSSTSMALTAAEVDAILAKLVSLDGTGGTTQFKQAVTINGAGVTAPTAAGVASKATLTARGCVVTTV